MVSPLFHQTSIQNILAGRIKVIADDEHPGLALARVEVGESVIIARLVKRAVADMALTPGQEVWKDDRVRLDK